MKSAEAWVLSYLVNSLWQIPLLFAAGWLAARAARVVGAAAEHRVWVGVLLLQSVLPAVSMFLPGWLRGALFSTTGGLRAADDGVSVVMGTGMNAVTCSLSLRVLIVLVFGYALLCVYFAVRFAVRCVRLRTMRREAVALMLWAESATAWAQCSARFGVNGAVIASSTTVRGPVTLGIWSKLMLLPADMLSELDAEDFCSVIAHEMAHMRRNDFVKNLMYEIVAIPVSYHPMLWLTRKHVTESREMVCDAMAAEVTGRHAYGQSLLRMASFVSGATMRVPHAIGIFDADVLERRVMKMAEKQKKAGWVGRLAVAAACAALTAGACGPALALSLHANDLEAVSSAGGVSVPSSVMAGNRIGGVNPKYPVDAKKARVQGTVVLKATIGADGNVGNLDVVSGPQLLRQSSLDAVKTWKYKPYLLNGNPVVVETRINIVYSLAK